LVGNLSRGRARRKQPKTTSGPVYQEREQPSEMPEPAVARFFTFSAAVIIAEY
jgi:hypothetical protein